MTHEDDKTSSDFPELGFYYHYKRDPNGAINNYAYEVIGFARHTEDKSFFVLYKPLYETNWSKPATFQARPLGMFMESVMKEGKSKQRFTKITDPEVIATLTAIRDTMYA